MSPQDKKLVNMKNENRKTVMNGMAKAIIRVNRDRENEETMKKAMPLAVEQFAALRRDKAKKDGGYRMQMAIGIKNSLKRIYSKSLLVIFKFSD